MENLEQGVEDNQNIGLNNEDCNNVNENVITMCSNCREYFDSEAFSEHICGFFQNNAPIDVNQLIKAETVGIDRHPCVQQLRQNMVRWKQFNKEVLKINVGKSEKKLDVQVKCPISECRRTFNQLSGYTKHVEKHTMNLASSESDGKFGVKFALKCYCGYLMFSKTDALKHYEAHESLDSDEEPEAEGEIEESLIPLSKYEAIKTEINKFTGRFGHGLAVQTAWFKILTVSSVLQCEFCDWSFSDVSELLEHSAKHDPVRGFECSMCEVNFKTFRELFVHREIECAFQKPELKRNWDLTRYYVCNVCENKFTSHEKLYDHRYTCYHFFPRCSIVSPQCVELTCEICGNCQGNATVLIQHFRQEHLTPSKTQKQNVGVKSRQYLCDVCGKTYTQSSHLWQHLRFHKGVKPFVCPEEGCNRRFTIRPDLNDHIRKCHTRERPYHCEQCGKSFLTGSVYYQHRLIHKGERRYGCSECGKRFYRADALKNHQRIHTGEKPFACTFCSKCFRQRGDKDKHIRARHPHFDSNMKLPMVSGVGAQNHEIDPILAGIDFRSTMYKLNIQDIDGTQQ